ncbi:hypothetical protein LZC95_30550 [Pendulispora brunnea]|uniref:Peptidase M1 membrane alanine aminopeptidase domain-containing protein n=1 Tax=Pendulispora brunnea TaxID=2905690 RepID=A0ABZ2JWC9_9BACT
MGRRIGYAVLAIVLSACSSSPSSNDDGPDKVPSTQEENDLNRAITGTVTRYDYAVDLATGAVRDRLTVRADPPGGDCFSASCEVPATDAEWQGAPAASSSQSDGALLVCGRSRVLPWQTLRVSSRSVVPEEKFLGLDVGFSRKKDLAGGTFTYLLSWVGGCSHFGPCDADPSRLASFHFDVEHAPGDMVLCPGKIVQGEQRTRCELSPWSTGSLAPTYSAVAVASDPLWKRTPWMKAAGVDFVFYEVPNLPGGNIAPVLDKGSVTGFFEWITDLLGPFPYGDELRVAAAPTVWSGFEHPANIILSEKLPTRTGPFTNTVMHVLMHEIVHQWAGDRATLAAVGDFVWKESTAEYLAYVFEDEHRDAAEGPATRAYWDRISLNAKFHPRPLENPTPPVQTFYGDVYGPGPMVLYLQLEALVGRAAVVRGIQFFLARPAARSVEDLRRALERAAHVDLGKYFDAWVFGSGKPEWPVFTVATSQSGSDVTVTVTQTAAKVHPCVVEVEVASASGKVLVPVTFGLDASSNTATAHATLQGEVTGTVVDPNHRVIDAKPASFTNEGTEEVLIF